MYMYKLTQMNACTHTHTHTHIHTHTHGHIRKYIYGYCTLGFCSDKSNFLTIFQNLAWTTIFYRVIKYCLHVFYIPLVFLSFTYIYVVGFEFLSFSIALICCLGHLSHCSFAYMKPSLLHMIEVVLHGKI